MSTQLDGLVAVVTGGGRGLGRCLVARLARDGARVAVNDVDAASCRAAAAEIGAAALAVVGDVSVPATADALVEETVARFGRVDILVNNAAAFATVAHRSALEVEADELDRVVSTNARLVLLPSQRAIRQMREHRGGRIVNICSGSILAGTPGLLPYVASKGAVFAMTRVLAAECGQWGITVNSVAPGLLDTPGARAHTSEAAFALQRSIRPIARDGVPEDVEEAVSFLASPGSGFVTGQMLVVNGGAQFW